MSFITRLKSAICTVRLRAAAGPHVLLTFDDGPHQEITPAILRLLKRHRARAVFFVVGSRISRAPGLLREILADGHVIGNHSFAHPLDRQPGVVGYWRDVMRAQAEIAHACGLRPKLFRPPLGQLSIASLTASKLTALQTVLWSVDSEDWRMRQASDVRPTLNRLLELLDHRPLREIVLLHDEKVHTVMLLEPLLETLGRRGVDLCGAVELL
jgi:peptidoglycan/xylan/chitin deacetylase (PgdA/CDA1 family)